MKQIHPKLNTFNELCLLIGLSPSKATVHSLNYATTAQNTFKTLLGLPKASCIFPTITSKIDLILGNSKKTFGAK